MKYLEDYVANLHQNECEPLTIEEENALFENLTPENRKKIVLANQRYLIAMVKENYGDVAKNEEEFMDILSEAQIGLNEAISMYDVSKAGEGRFCLFAKHYVKRRVVAFLRDTSTVGAPDGIFNVVYRARTMMAENEDMTREELKARLKKMGYTYDLDVAEKALENINMISLDTVIGDEEKSSLMDTIDAGNDVAEHMEIVDRNEMVKELLGLASDKERRILVMSFGLDGKKPMTNEAIGEVEKIGRESVRQIKERFYTKAKQYWINKEALAKARMAK